MEKQISWPMAFAYGFGFIAFCYLAAFTIIPAVWKVAAIVYGV